MEMIANWFNAMASWRQVLSKFAFLLPFIGIFLLLWLIFRKTKPGVPPLKRLKFWLVFIASSLMLFVLFILMVLIAFTAGTKKREPEPEKENAGVNYRVE